MFKMVEDFNKNIIGVNRELGPIQDETEYKWGINAIHEELSEWQQAREDGDFIGEIDAVMDIIYFSMGFLTRMGIPHEQSKSIFEAIHRANMEKKLGTKNRVFTHSLDAIKPNNWVPPEERIANILDTIKG